MASRFPSTGVNDHLMDKIIRSPYFLQSCASIDAPLNNTSSPNHRAILTIAELAIDMDFIGGLFGGLANKDRVTPFACLVFKVIFMMGGQGILNNNANETSSSSSSSGGFSMMTKKENAVFILSFLEEFVQQAHHKYLRVFGIVCLRLLAGGSAAETHLGAVATEGKLAVRIHKALDVGFLDYRRVRLMQPNGAITITTVDQICDTLMFQQPNQNKTFDFLGLSLSMIPSRKQMLEIFPEESKEELLKF